MTGKRVRYLHPRTPKRSRRRGTVLLASGLQLRIVVRWDDQPERPQWVNPDSITFQGVTQTPIAEGI